MRAILAALLLLAMAACAPVRPDVGGSVGPGGAAAHAGVETGRINAGVSTNGSYASVDVVDTRNVDVAVGTHGTSASVRLGNSPVRVGVGRGGWRVGF
ncbi:hypothetical protein [Mangrovicoccus algicola]|uniref:Lipoprotein n=1 Tax=Mangrovicoccus algicola TaxID=2771008 RepID=A0A8J7CVZ2_9RHOB|nr:hypothetical protein [Mangrovicoccus algicola]MBE3639329.1 hypothetical protein [Mangrovicoccus algicola]